MFDWIAQHWEFIVGIAWGLISVLNTVTVHYGEERAGLRKTLLFVVDLLSLLTARGAPTAGRVPLVNKIKLPMVQASPLTDGAKRRAAIYAAADKANG